MVLGGVIGLTVEAFRALEDSALLVGCDQSPVVLDPSGGPFEIKDGVRLFSCRVYDLELADHGPVAIAVFGVGDFDPVVEFWEADEELVAINDNWADIARAEPLPGMSDLDSLLRLRVEGITSLRSTAPTARPAAIG